MKDTIRLDKYLTEMGEGTRSQIKEMARKGRIDVYKRQAFMDESVLRQYYLYVEKKEYERAEYIVKTCLLSTSRCV